MAGLLISGRFIINLVECSKHDRMNGFFLLQFSVSQSNVFVVERWVEIGLSPGISFDQFWVYHFIEQVSWM